MEIFSNEVASTLQYFTLPLEVIGLTLAAIEVRFPSLASRIAGYIVTAVEKGERDGADLKRIVSKKELVMTAIGVSILVFAVITSGYPNAVVYGSCTFVAVISLSYIAAVKWIPGKTVGTLGIIIAAFGVLGEAYQLTTQLVV